MTSPSSRSTAVAASLMLTVGVLALAMAWAGKASSLEACSFVTGAACVWLTVRQSVWNFPIGMLNVATFCVVFFRAELYADAGLQIVYFVMGLMGWYLWLHGGEQRTALRVSRAENPELAMILVFVTVITVVLWLALARAQGAAPFFGTR